MDNNHKQQVPAGLLLNPVHLLALGFGSGLVPTISGDDGNGAGGHSVYRYPADSMGALYRYYYFCFYSRYFPLRLYGKGIKSP